MSSFLYYLAALTCGGIAVLSLRERWRTDSAWSVSAAAALTAIAYTVRGSIFFLHDTGWMLIYPFCGILIPAAFASFFQRWLHIKTQRPFIQLGSAILFCVALILATKKQANSISILGASWLAIGGSAVAYLVIREWRTAREPIRQSRMLYLAGFFLSALFFTLIEGLARLQGSSGQFYDIQSQGPLPPISALLSSLLFYCLWLNLKLTRLVGLDEYFTRLVSLFIPAFVLGGVMTVSLSLGSSSLSHTLFQAALLSGLFLAFYPLMQDPISEIANGIFNRKGQQLTLALKEIQLNLPQLAAIDDLDGLFLQPLYESGRVSHAALYIWRHEDGIFMRHSVQGGEFDVNLISFGQDPFGDLLTVGQFIYSDALLKQAHTHKDSTGQSALRALRSLEQQKIDAALPLWVDDILLGWVGLQADGVSGGFSRKELARIQHMLDQAAIQLETIRSIEHLKEQHRLATIGTMSAGLAHEIRNPLAGIKGAVQYLQEGATQAETADFYELIEHETERLNTIVQQFLDYARPLQQQQQPIQINDLLVRCQMLMATSHPEIQWQMRLDKKVSLIYGDPTQIQQIFINLIQNGIQAMNGCGIIDISSQLDRCYEPPNQGQPAVQVKITDHGPGFSPEAKTALFTPFFTTKTNGVGLGLAITQRLVEAHDGEIQLSQPTARGATIILRFPIPLQS